MKAIFSFFSAWFLLCGGPVLVHATPQDWSGTWESKWRNGAAVLYLHQEGSRLTGQYPLLDGKIEGTVEGRQARGSWRQRDDKAGGFIFTLSEDGRSFTGRFDTGEWWTGRLVSQQKSPKMIHSDFSSPREVLRTFLIAGGASVGGEISQLQTASGCLKLTDADVQTLDPVEWVRLMYQLLDMTTLRLWDVPGSDQPTALAAGNVEIAFTQAGTGESVSFQFIQTPEGWRLVPLEEAELREALERLQLTRGERGEVQTEDKPFASARDTLRTFMKTVGSDFPQHQQMLMRTMDLSYLGDTPRPQEAALLAEYLKRVIDRVGFVVFQEIPDDPFQEAPYLHFRHPVDDVILARTGETDAGTPQWQFTAETMQSIRELYLAVEDMPTTGFVEMAPLRPWTYFWMRQELRAHAPWLLWRTGQVELWQWGALLLSGVVCWLASMLISRLILALGRRSGTLGELLAEKGAGRGFVRRLRLVWIGFFLYAVLGGLGLPERLSVILGRLSLSLGAAALMWVVIHVLNLAGRLNAKNLENPERNHRGVLLSLTLGVTRTLAILAGLLWLADIWTVPYSSMLAGLGIGGIAVALATQNTLQNVIAGFTLFADRPLSVGDFCKYDNNLGTVERIGLRSVRIRSLERSVVSIPTAVFADMQLENLAVRDRFLLRFSLGLRYETTGDQLRFVLAEIRKMLVGHPKILGDPARVRFDGFGDYSLNVDIFSYVSAVDWNEYLAVKEDISFRLMQIVEAAGTGFAFPSQTTYLTRDSGLDTEKSESAEREVGRWRTLNKLPAPDFSEEDLEQMEDRLDYPPADSVLRPRPDED